MASRGFSKKDVAFLSRFNSFTDYSKAMFRRDLQEGVTTLHAHGIASPDNSQESGYKIRRYRSGEMSIGQYLTGSRSKVLPPSREGALVTTGFTVPARVKIRRATENADTNLKYFITLTFAPAALSPWHLNDNGTVKHDYAKYKLKKFLNTCLQTKKRQGKHLQYVWVAELQKNGNIHFHIIWNEWFPVKWLVKIWDQAKNSVDTETLNDTNHVVNYIRKYVTKDEESAIQGNRYFISQGLRDTMRPLTEEKITGGENMRVVRSFLLEMKEDIESRGGIVLDFGCNIPRPRRSKTFQDKNTKEIRKTKGVRRDLAEQLLSGLYGQVLDGVPF